MEKTIRRVFDIKINSNLRYRWSKSIENEIIINVKRKLENANLIIEVDKKNILTDRTLELLIEEINNDQTEIYPLDDTILVRLFVGDYIDRIETPRHNVVNDCILLVENFIKNQIERNK